MRDGINFIIEALRKRKNRTAYVGVRHKEAAVFMASGTHRRYQSTFSALQPMLTRKRGRSFLTEAKDA